MRHVLGWAATTIEDVDKLARSNRRRATAAPDVAEYANAAAHLLEVGAQAMRRELDRMIEQARAEAWADNDRASGGEW